MIYLLLDDGKRKPNQCDYKVAMRKAGQSQIWDNTDNNQLGNKNH